MAPDRGGMWIGSRSGLIYSRGDELLFIDVEDGLPSAYVSSLAVEPDAGLWIATDGGLAFRDLDGQVHSVEHPLLDRVYLLSLHRSTDGRIWLGLQNGGVRELHFSLDGGVPRIERVQVWDAAAGLSDMTIWSIDENDRGDVWVGTNGDGAFKVSRDGSIERFGVAQGLTNAFIWQLEIDRIGAVWFYTNRGLNRLEPGGRVLHFDLADGLPDLEGMATAALEDRAGLLWFGTSRGVVRYDPAQDHVNDQPPTVRIVELRSQRLGRLEPGSAVPADAGLMTARFTALTFREEASVRFRYRLVGTDAEWSAPIANRSLSFAGLRPGDYELVVEAANEANLW
ncbi:MAG: triple tyrosine motif-containing protein, partial [Acidobacteriota bacterium]